jgi:acetyl esterase/lipase
MPRRFDPAMPLVHPLPDPDRVEVRPGLAYAEAGGRELAMDVYLPAGRDPKARLPAVLLVHGEAPPEALRGVRGWGQYRGWGRLLAAEGLAGVAAEHRAVAEAGFEGVVVEVGAALAALAAGPAAGVRCAAPATAHPATSSRGRGCRPCCSSGPARTAPS